MHHGVLMFDIQTTPRVDFPVWFPSGLIIVPVAGLTFVHTNGPPVGYTMLVASLKNDAEKTLDTVAVTVEVTALSAEYAFCATSITATKKQTAKSFFPI
jgi:hypothetical protein